MNGHVTATLSVSFSFWIQNLTNPSLSSSSPCWKKQLTSQSNFSTLKDCQRLKLNWWSRTEACRRWWQLGKEFHHTEYTQGPTTTKTSMDSLITLWKEENGSSFRKSQLIYSSVLELISNCDFLCDYHLCLNFIFLNI
mgnify:CR=1 FL=1